MYVDVQVNPEMAALVDSVCAILSDTPSVAMAMLVHFHWDVRQIIENHLMKAKLVRKEIGLNPKSRPPFLRFDKFGPPAAAFADAPFGFAL